MIWLGYLICVLYLCALVFGLGTLLKRFFGTEVSRKAIHILSFGLFPIYHALIGPGFHLIVLCGAMLAFALLSYFFGLAKPMEREGRGTPGTVYYAASLTVLSILVVAIPNLYPYFGLAFAFLAFGDGLGGLIGYLLKGPKIHGDKTFIGSAACLVACFLSGYFYSLAFFPEIPYLAIVLLSLIATIAELIDFGLDNVFMPLIVFGLSLVLIGGPIAIYIAVAVFIALFLLIFLAGLMTYYGALFSSLIGAMVFYCGSYPALLFFIAMYLCYFAVHLIKKARKAKDGLVVEKGHKKDAYQVLCNGGVCIVAFTLNIITKDPLFTLVGMCGCVSLFTDTMASDLGALSNTSPYDFFHKKQVPMGLSGGMTELGTFGAILFAILSGVALSMALGYPLRFGFVIGGIAILSCFLDTLLGSLLQAKYRCPVCQTVMEKRTHHEEKTELVSGLRWMNNDVVNLIASMASFGLGMVLFAL